MLLQSGGELTGVVPPQHGILLERGVPQGLTRDQVRDPGPRTVRGIVVDHVQGRDGPAEEQVEEPVKRLLVTNVDDDEVERVELEGISAGSVNSTFTP